MSAPTEQPWDYFPDGYPRDRAAAISVAIELGLHEDGQGDEPAPSSPPASRVDWTVSAGVQANIVRHGHRFAAIIQPASHGQWGVLGVVTPETPTSAAGAVERAHEVLAEHAHELLGVVNDFGHALQLGEHFVLHSPLPSETCGCAELEPAEPPIAAGGALDDAPDDVLARLTVAFVEAGIERRHIRLEQSPLGCVGGYVLSGRFAHQSAVERHAWLRELVEAALGAELSGRVGFVVAMTPAEVE